jgi:RNA polymerase sigma factor (sigma-70 family)
MIVHRWSSGIAQPSMTITDGLDAARKDFEQGGGRSVVWWEEERTFAMAVSSVGSTNPELLRRVAALWDDPAWREFFARYEPFARARCSVYGLDADSVDELCQRVWVELARRMPAYQYDPGGSFRGWLRRLCHHRAVDLHRERNDFPLFPLADKDLADKRGQTDANGDDDEVAAGKLFLLAEARQAQEEVRRKVKPIRWEVFWRVVIEGEPLNETAASLGLKYATAYAAARHVAKLLREEGRRRRARLGLDDSLS